MELVKNSYINERQKLFLNLLKRQRKDIRTIGNYGRLKFDDIKRVEKVIRKNIFDNDNCCLFIGCYKNGYSLISFRGINVSLQKLLYHNYIGDIDRWRWIKYKCDNIRTCCNLNHLELS